MKEPVPASRYGARYFEESCGGGDFFARFGPKVLKPAQAYAFLRAGLAPGMRVLDLGCGRGEILYQARAAGAWAVGSDFSPASARLAAQVSGCPTLLCDAKELPFADASFDRVFFLGVIDHLHDWELKRVFAELARVLKPGGAVLVSTCVNRLYFKNWTYAARRALARWAERLGASAREPRPPRSAEDEVLHVNEHSGRDLVRFFRAIGWSAKVEARPNDKLCARELYGDHPPADFPLQPASRAKRALHFLFFRPPLRALLAREFFTLARPGRTC